MYKTFFSLVFFSNLVATLSAASFVVDFEELFNEQKYVKTLTIEAESLDSHIILNNGQEFEMISEGPWPAMGDLQEIALKAPQVNLIVETFEGSIWERSLDLFEFRLLKKFSAEQTLLELDFHGNPALAGSSSGPEALFTFSQYLIKNLFLNSISDIHLNLQASSSTSMPQSDFHAFFGMGSQSLDFVLKDLGNEKNGSWAMKTSMLGKGALLDLLVTAMKGMCHVSKTIVPQNSYEALVKDFFENMDYGMQALSPVFDWKGVWLIVSGDFTYEAPNDADLIVMMNNLFKVETYDKSWNSAIGLKSVFHRISDSPTIWKQEVQVKNPEKDLENICQWFQVNCTDQLATLLNMPSITYYGSYFPIYFKDALVQLLTSIGQAQADETIVFGLSGHGTSVDALCEINPSEIGQNFIQSIKNKIGGWFS